MTEKEEAPGYDEVVAGVEQLTMEKDVFTTEERDAFSETRKLLVADGIAAENLVDRDIGFFTMIEKLRSRKAADKYKQYLDVMAEYGFSIKELHDEATYDEFKDLWDTYQVCGLTPKGLSVMFIRGKSIPIEREKDCVRLGLLFWMAVHSHVPSLRSGITFVIDQGMNNTKPVGNERKLQRVWSVLPLRPQDLFIANTTMIKRIFINGLLTFAKLFTSSKVLARVKFASIATVEAAVTKESMPECYGGLPRESSEEWARKRLAESEMWFQ